MVIQRVACRLCGKPMDRVTSAESDTHPGCELVRDGLIERPGTNEVSRSTIAPSVLVSPAAHEPVGTKKRGKVVSPDQMALWEPLSEPERPAASDRTDPAPRGAQRAVRRPRKAPSSRAAVLEAKTPVKRRWPPEMLTCACTTPFDDDSRPVGRHCSDCHGDYGSGVAYGMHRPNWMKPCRDPNEVADVDTGRPLLVRVRVDGCPIWMVNKY